MNKTHGFFAVSFVALCVCATAFAAQNVPNIMSKYGEIQSVNKYSSNPFWTPNSPYNQRFPTPIYATGPDLNTGDCNRIVQNLVSTYCADRQNCSNLRIADVRPNVMVQLSQLPGHNFATSCGGYIDTIFENYKKTYGNSSAGIVNIVPTQTKTTAPSIQIENPFTTPTTEFDERAAELERLQRQTTATAAVTPAAFPKTIDDLSFTDRMANASAGYEPYKDLSAYKTPKFETENEYYERMKSVLTHNISYVGAGAKGCPPTYMTGRGATVSCTPTINHGTCSAWCTDAALTNCQTSYTISPNDRDDKIFYGKCTCDTSAGYEMDGYKCVKPGIIDNGDGTGIIDGGDDDDSPTPTNCADADYMDANCKCTIVPGTHEDEESGKCVCDNGKDISKYCDDGEDRFIVWYCLAKNTAAVRVIHKDGKSALSNWSKYCRTNQRGISNCIGTYAYPYTGIITKLFKEKINPDVFYGYSNFGELVASDRARGWPARLELSKGDVETFISEIQKDISNISNECNSSHSRDWWLFIDKLPNAGHTGYTDLKPYKAICIGGDSTDETSCKPGTIEIY